MKDFRGRDIRPGDHLAYAMKKGSSAARLERRFVREVYPDHVVVTTQLGPVDDRRLLGRITDTSTKTLVIASFEDLNHL